MLLLSKLLRPAIALLSFVVSSAGIARADQIVDLPQLARAAQGGHQPLSDESFAPVRSQLLSAAKQLENRLGGDSAFAQAWKAYLKWPQLEQHLEADAEITGQTLRELDQVQRRLRANKPGLELPVFQQTADALEHYRELAFWYALGQRRDTRPRYDTFLLELEKQLTRNLEQPTIESTRQIGKIIGMVDQLGHAPQLVQQVRTTFQQPNMWAEASTVALQQLADRPVQNTQPVRDCILGAHVRGTANSSGNLSLTTLPSDHHIAIKLHLTGQILSTTTSYKKPVCVSSNGCTSFVATKHLLLSDGDFSTQSATASARTRTRTCSIRKTGGNLGHRLIEKIARKKVAESKGQAEYISARHAERKVAAKFDRQVAEVLTAARKNYDEKFQAPLTRIGMFPEHLAMSSTANGIQLQSTLVSSRQITTHLAPPNVHADNDFSLRVHESAVNNFLPHLIAGATIRQDKQSEPPRLEGEVPGWLKKLAQDPKVGEQFDSTSPAPENEELPADAEQPAFKPWSFLLNNEHPISVSFEDQKITLRIRIAELTTLEDGEESVRKNWDFLVTYRIEQNDNRIVLRREGEIEVLPTDFDPQWFGDPRWDDKLTAQQVGIRKNLEDNINKRVASGGGFPLEIDLPPIEIPGANDTKLPLQLQQLNCDQGWLTLGYQLP